MYIADLHIHSKYSRATSKELEPEPLDAWARRKGIGLVGTGDFTHPTWRAELRDKLAEAEEGLYTLKGAGPDAPRFVITGEISSIYKKNGKVRKVHSLILLPHLEAAETLSRRLEAIGNLHSDGRPILGLDCRDLLEITLESCPDAVFIPAHIWTPHFSLFGAFSGFDTIGECFGDLTGHIHALETGLSSDPTMICRCSALDGYTLVSNSDAHSPSKLGREANLLDTGLSYPELARAIQTGEGFHGTIEFFPEEGKYHFDGHRNCGVCLSPVEAEAAGGVCPVCGKRLTTGVLHRVEQLADRPEGYVRPDARPFESLVPLPEVIAASEGGSAAGKKVGAKYEAMLAALGPEFTILREVPLEDIRAAAGPCVAEGIRRLRAGQVVRKPGYDGAYGVIELLSPAEREDLKGQVSLFGAEAPKAAKTARGRVAKPARSGEEGAAPTGGLNGAQRTAASAEEATVAVLAGPGTGKTHTLVERVAWLVEERGAKPSELTAVTFTNRAAGELRARLEGRLGKRAARAMTIGTFHAICLELLGDVPLAGPYEQRAAAAAALAELGRKGSPGAFLRAISRHKTGADGGDDPAFALYQEKLEGKLDFDDLLLETLRQWEGGRSDRCFTHLLVDEFQDIDRLQLRLLRAWRREGGTFFAIGDPDQSIYGFRGADAGCFSALGAERTVRLTENYRSTPEILAAALPVAEAIDGAPRRMETHSPHGAEVRLLTAEGDRAEAIFVAKEIARMVGGIGMLEAQALGAARGARSFGDIAVLYRTRRQAALLEECLAHDGIPCVVTGREDFLLDGEVQAALAWLEGQQGEGKSPAALLEEWTAHHTPSGGVERLRNMAVFFGDVPAFLRNLTIGQEGDLLRRAGLSYAAGAVTLSTLHGAKGLEWPVVFLCGVGEGRIPLERKGLDTDEAEERRLLYVGMTRAREELVLLSGGEPSRFLAGLPLRQDTAHAPVPRPLGVQLSLFE